MIKSFYIDNFKSLIDLRLPPAPHQLGSFTCLVGLNGAGKSTVLQAFDFIGHLANGQVATWLKQREWQAADLTSRFLKKKLIAFELAIEFVSEEARAQGFTLDDLKAWKPVVAAATRERKKKT